MVPTSLPKLPKPSRTPEKSPKPDLQNPEIYRTNQDKSLYSLSIPFRGPFQFFLPPPYTVGFLIHGRHARMTESGLELAESG